jgi:hypothetical protein
LNINFNSEQHRGDKRNPATPDGNNEKATMHQKQKKTCCAVKVDTASKEKMDLGMFYLCNNSINPSDVFPRTCLTRFVQISPARVKSATM